MFSIGKFGIMEIRLEFRCLCVIFLFFIATNFAFCQESESLSVDSQVQELNNKDKIQSVSEINASKNEILIDKQIDLITDDSTIKKVSDQNIKAGVAKQEIKLKEVSIMDNWLEGNYATGNWFGARTYLEEHGVTINSSLLYSPFGKTRGGMESQVKTGGYTLFNLSTTIDTEKMGLWKGGTFYTLYQNKHGMGLSGRSMGDYQVYDGYDFREMSQLSEYWYQHTFKDNVARLKFGKQDANIDFCYLNSGYTFLNTSFSIMPTVLLPTYPNQALGFMAEVSPKKWMSIKNGIYNKHDTPFYIAEIEFKPTIKELPGRYFVGYWTSNGTTNAGTLDKDIDGNYVTRPYKKNYGGYAAFEQMVYKENKGDPNDFQGLTTFAQFGISPSDRNDVSEYTGGGLYYKGLIPKRDKDLTGIGIASVNFSNRLSDLDGRSGHESAIECYHRLQLTPWFYLQPDVQFIYKPGGNTSNSVAIGLRSVVNF